MSGQNGISYLTPPRPVSEIQQEARRSASAQEDAALMFAFLKDLAALQLNKRQI